MSTRMSEKVVDEPQSTAAGDAASDATVPSSGRDGDPAAPTAGHPDERPGSMSRRYGDRFGDLTNRTLAIWTTRILLVGVTTLVAFVAMHPGLIFTNNTPTGGDMGAHVWGPAYLRDHLLSEWKLSGWSMDWYSGLPVYRFYMVIPALLITMLNAVFAYGVAFKIVAVLGIVTLPLCCWAFGRLSRFAFPVPELFAVVGLVYLFDESYTIYGGNIASTMAGEFAFSISLSFAMLGFGLMAHGLQTGRHRGTTAVVIALAVLCHGIVAIFVVVGLLLMALLHLTRRRAWYFVSTAATGALLSAFWIIPFLLNHAYMTDMKYQGEPGHGSFDSYWDMFFALPPFFDVLFTTLAVVGFGISVARRNVIGTWIGLTGTVFSAFVFLFRDSLPVIGLLWNPRLLPFVNMCRYLLAAIAVHEIVQAVWRARANARYTALLERVAVRGDASIGALAVTRRPADTSWAVGTVTAVAVLGVTGIVLGFRFQELPGGEVVQAGDGYEYQWGVGPLKATTDYGNDGFVDGWARWNFSGYEGKSYWGEYRDVVLTMKELGEDPAHGCGRALWENYEGNDKYGTTMAFMLLPFWTDGCIGSSEGLYFEASGTTPYHFLAAAAMSKQSSNPVRELRYTNNNASVGVPYLQDLGMRYYLAVTPEAVAQAAGRPELTLVRTAGPWHVYEVASSDIVVPLDRTPVVVAERPGDQRERWLEIGTSWYQNRDEWAAVPAADGPDSWQRIDVEVDLERRVGTEPGAPGRQVDVVVPAQTIEPRPVEPAVVSDVVVADEGVSFSVDRVGSPVLVRVSYFPNWTVTGADGPYRIAPNMMVVVPTDTEVRLEFTRSGVDVASYALTAVGFVLLPILWRRGRLPVELDDRDHDHSADGGGSGGVDGDGDGEDVDGENVDGEGVDAGDDGPGGVPPAVPAPGATGADGGLAAPSPDARPEWPPRPFAPFDGEVEADWGPPSRRIPPAQTASGESAGSEPPAQGPGEAEPR